MRSRRNPETPVPTRPLGATGEDSGAPVLAYDPLVAGLHQQVLVSTDGSQTRQLVGDPHSPLRNFVLALVDPVPRPGPLHLDSDL